ncbi:MAG: tRNA (N6-isopentenyl adenosine(37)-C2)-methylthiotransferase MiaB [Candidatus Latescibacterota bacterium]|nr:tRNA (N6-isopentenyl adenosine(37)-C2)-methylthiotransferase MiaB [Candidatus Latescibacterota bacterium]
MTSRTLPMLQTDAAAPDLGTTVPVAPTHHRSVYIETYGCQMNVADTEVVATVLDKSGYHMVDSPEQANVILVNTCAVRENAEERVFGRISQLAGLRQRNPELTIGILGCMAQHLAKSLPQRAPYVDLVAGPDSYSRLPELLSETSDETLLDTRLSRTENYVGIDPTHRRDTTNAWVTIIRGCDKFCSFCIVPFVRGRERSVDSTEVLRQVHHLAEEGFREVTLLGQTVNSYGDASGIRFPELLRSVSAVDGIERVRFTSPYPVDLDDDVISAMAETPEVCPSLHLPVQSASPRQLESMRRGYTIKEYRQLVDRLRRAIPSLALTTDIIVGFCGETQEDFELTRALMEEIRYDSAFMFRYSERSGTFAYRKMEDNVPEAVKGERLRTIIELQEGISREINENSIGHTTEVLVEGRSRRTNAKGSPTWYGRNPQGKVVVFPQEAPTNEFVEVVVNEVTSHTLRGSLIPPT